ncbi:hypothetical protein J3F84DRAFT_363267 [Trichoderma pleuroticola]
MMTLLWPQKLDWAIGFDVFKKGNLVKRWSAVKVGKRYLTAGETTPKGVWPWGPLPSAHHTKFTNYQLAMAS